MGTSRVIRIYPFEGESSLPSVRNHTVSSSFLYRKSKQPKIFTISAVFLYLAPWRGLEPPIYRLGGGCVIHYATRAYPFFKPSSMHLFDQGAQSVMDSGGVCSIQLSDCGMAARRNRSLHPAGSISWATVATPRWNARSFYPIIL